MKNQAVKNESNLVLHEQLALRRLKELAGRDALPARARPVRANLAQEGELAAHVGRWLWRVLAAAAVALWRRRDLERETAPGQPAERWHEVERLRAERAIRML